MGWFDEAIGGLLGGSSTPSSGNNGGGYGGFIDSLFGSSQTAPQKEAKTQDEGLFGFGKNNERQPTGTTFKAYGKHHRNAEEALEYLDRSTCYSGTLRCPVCGQAKNKPSDVERCKAQHRRDGYEC